MEKQPKQINVRTLQHNLSLYMTMAKAGPILITKGGKEEIMLINPKDFNVSKKSPKKNNVDDLAGHKFIGMHKNKLEWKNKPSFEIARELRERAWYGR